MKQIKIIVDTNDADYATEMSVISDKDIKTIMPVIDAINSFKPYKVDGKYSGTHYNNFPYGEAVRADLGEKSPEQLYVMTKKCTKKAFEVFESFLPSTEYGFHTIESIEILNIESIDVLLMGK